MTNKLHVLKNMHQFGAKVKYGLKRSKNIPAMCGVGNKSFCIAPNMKIYPCHRRFFTNPEDFIGEIVNHKGKIIEDKYDFCLTANNPKNICTNGISCYECLQTKNTYCRICINSNKAKNGNELIGCSGNCLISSIEDIWQTTTYNYFKEKGVVQ